MTIKPCPTQPKTKNSPRNGKPVITLAALELRLSCPNLAARPFHQAYSLQRLLIAVIYHKLTPVELLPALVRSWDVLEERKRILRGVPLPGQLRPDLDPVQLAKALKRSRSRRPLEMLADIKRGFADPAERDAEPVASPAPTVKIGCCQRKSLTTSEAPPIPIQEPPEATTPTTEKPKESLSHPDRPHTPGEGGDNQSRHTQS